MKKRNLGLLYLFASLCLGASGIGCTKTLGGIKKGSDTSAPLPAVQEALLTVTSDFPDAKFDIAKLEKRLKKTWEHKKIFKRVSLLKQAEDDSSQLHIQARIVHWKNVDRDRFFAGGFAGWNEMTVEFQLHYPNDQNLIHRFDVEGRSKGWLAGGGKMEYVIHYIATQSAQYLKSLQ